MTRIDFAFGAAHRLRTACEVVHKQYLAGRRIVVYTRDTKRLDWFDQLLWGYESTAFIPHVHDDDPLVMTTPVILTRSAPAKLLDETATHKAWLLNLDLECPPDTAAFDRVLEIVSEHEQDKTAARARWRSYQAQGYQLRAHQLTKSAD